jgi:flavin reductase (DIM6/NTAB) family NADH-FMN oxidoreductase RutF/rubredoxin
MDIEALYKISYGLYIVSSGNKDRGNGFISNTVFQVTSDPPKFAVCCNKNNLTADFIIDHHVFSVSVLSITASPEIFGRFGYRSGRDTDKMKGIAVNYGVSGVPIVTAESIAYLEFSLLDRMDAGTHWIFIGLLVDAGVLDATGDPMTYQYYRDVRKGIAPKNAPTYIDQSKLELNKKTGNKFKCPSCGYIYDENVETIKFADLPDDWTCPQCGTEKSDFIEI